MNFLMSGGMNAKKVDALISLTSIRSEDVIEAVKDHLINGVSIQNAADFRLIDPSNVKRALVKVNSVAARVELCKEIDMYGKSEIVTKVSESCQQ